MLLRGAPLRNLKPALKLAVLGKKDPEGVSSFSSLATELAATIGVGNVFGVVSAMTVGGPGALLWMEVSALLGLATKLVESTLSVKYRVFRTGELPLGGPMVTLSRAFPFPKAGRILGFFYAVFALLSCFGMGNLIQANAIAVTLREAFGVDGLKVALGLTILTILSVVGGRRGISKIATYLVPAMGALYLAGCLGIIVLHPLQLFPALRGILVGAFCPKAVSGGIFGTVTVSVFRSMSTGVARGVFSNEAGLGAGGITAAAAAEESCVKQGLISMTGVFFDTILICSVTGISFAVSGILGVAEGGAFMEPATLASKVFENTYGRFGTCLLAICISLFAFATILGWASQGEAVFRFLFGNEKTTVFKLLYGISAFWGACAASSTLWNLADVANGLMAVPNLICILVMAPSVAGEIKNWRWNE